MKTIVRIERAVEGEQIAAEKLPPLAIRMIADGFAARRADFEEALLVVERSDKDRLPVYIAIGSKPPELAVGGRRVHSVFAPPDSQEPVASFHTAEAAEAWAAQTYPDKDYKVGEIDATDKPAVRVSVMVLLRRGAEVLFGRLPNGIWTLPETELIVSESVEAAVRRVLLDRGVAISKCYICGPVPFINSFLGKAGQHFLILCMVADWAAGEPTCDKTWQGWQWFPAAAPPQPLLIPVQQLIALLEKSAPVDVPVPIHPANGKQFPMPTAVARAVRVARTVAAKKAKTTTAKAKAKAKAKARR